MRKGKIDCDNAKLGEIEGSDTGRKGYKLSCDIIPNMPGLDAEVECDYVMSGGPGDEDAGFATEVPLPTKEDGCDTTGTLPQRRKDKADCDNAKAGELAVKLVMVGRENGGKGGKLGSDNGCDHKCTKTNGQVGM